MEKWLIDQEEQLKKPHLLLLPKDLQIEIINKLNPEELAGLSCSCKILRSAADDESLWRKFCSSFVDTTKHTKPDDMTWKKFYTGKEILLLNASNEH